MKKLILIITVLFFVNIALASNKDSMGLTKEQTKNMSQAMKVYQTTLNYPYPSWFSTELVGKNYTNENGNTFISEQIPTGQTFDNWKELYAVYSVYTKHSQFNLNKFINMSLAVYINNCGIKNLSLLNLSKKGDANAKTYLLFCYQFNNNLKQEAKSNKKLDSYLTNNGKNGEVALFKFLKVKDTYIKVYQEWKVPSFNVKGIEKNFSLITKIKDFNYKKAIIAMKKFANISATANTI